MSRGVVVSRTWQIIRLLESPQGCTLSELEGTLGCSRRTVMRDLKGLEDAGLPLYDQWDGREKRWKFVDGFTRQLPPPFSLSEVMALYFARALARPLKGTPVYDSLDSAFKKISSLLPRETKVMLDQLDESFVSRMGPHKDYRRHRELLDLVTRAQQRGRVLRVRYRSFARQETTDRSIAPYRLCYFHGGLYVIGHDDRHDDVRTFALERIQKAELTSERFVVPKSFDFETYMKSALGIFRGPERHVRIAFRGTAAHAIAEREWHPSQRIESRDNGTLVLSLKVADTLELRRWIMSFGAEAEVLEPTSLRNEIRDELQSLLDQLERMDLSPDQPFLPSLELETIPN